MPAQKYFTEEERRAANNAKSKKYRTAHPDRVKAIKRAYRQTHLSIEKKKRAVAYAKNRDKELAGMRNYWRVNKEALRPKKRAYYARTLEAGQDRRLRRVFGITLVDYNRMADSQGFTCAICRDVVEDKAAKMPGKARALHVDHCHRTGKIRQLLCGRCNSILGLCDESVERLQLIAQYILDHQ